MGHRQHVQLGQAGQLPAGQLRPAHTRRAQSPGGVNGTLGTALYAWYMPIPAPPAPAWRQAQLGCTGRAGEARGPEQIAPGALPPNR